MGNAWPSHKASYVLRLLQRQLGYVKVAGTQEGSHVWLEAPGRPRIRWAYHNKRSLAPRELKRLLVEDVKLSLDEAKEVLGL